MSNGRFGDNVGEVMSLRTVEILGLGSVFGDVRLEENV